MGGKLNSNCLENITVSQSEKAPKFRADLLHLDIINLVMVHCYVSIN